MKLFERWRGPWDLGSILQYWVGMSHHLHASAPYTVISYQDITLRRVFMGSALACYVFLCFRFHYFYKSCLVHHAISPDRSIRGRHAAYILHTI